MQAVPVSIMVAVITVAVTVPIAVPITIPMTIVVTVTISHDRRARCCGDLLDYTRARRRRRGSGRSDGAEA